MDAMDGSGDVTARSRPRAAWFVAVLVVAGLVAVSAWLLAGPRRALSRVPSDAAEHMAAATVVAGWQDGDVVRIDPYWYTGPRLLLSEQLPAVRFPYYTFDLRSDADPLHLLRFRRLWVVGAYEALDRDDAAFTGLPLRALTVRQDIPDLRVALHELPASPIRYDLLLDLGKARVRRGQRSCRWDAADLRHRCGEQSWKDVFIAVKDVGDATRQVVYVEPHPANTVLSIRYPAVPMDGTLVFHSGFSIEGARRTAGADTRLRLLVDGAVAADWIEPKNDYVWRTTLVPGDGGTHDVTLEVSAPEVGWRQICYDGAVVSAEGLSWIAP